MKIQLLCDDYEFSPYCLGISKQKSYKISFQDNVPEIKNRYHQVVSNLHLLLAKDSSIFTLARVSAIDISVNLLGKKFACLLNETNLILKL